MKLKTFLILKKVSVSNQFQHSAPSKTYCSNTSFYNSLILQSYNQGDFSSFCLSFIGHYFILVCKELLYITQSKNSYHIYAFYQEEVRYMSPQTYLGVRLCKMKSKKHKLCKIHIFSTVTMHNVIHVDKKHVHNSHSLKEIQASLAFKSSFLCVIILRGLS